MRFYLFYLTLCCTILPSCHDKEDNNEELQFWSSNNKDEIALTTNATHNWNKGDHAQNIHVQPIPEGQSSEEVILAAVVGKTTPDIYANMWQGNVKMCARAGVLVALDNH